ncbi:endonuclease/exonuclease/phosphatase family protein [Labedaea rhizosphaerae]|uniref:Endonuclease/exonuclease/phosphatase family metal-dependent hydrolase n=1 Tax=Labedaea rhizosphaerae TaxID=598644 RepID=A0A4R6SMX1_LABRH|nr:endonuclease/exonuclease/phosphatase family protein [Labedaea rhizosphaerae]TDQ04692.1 endonuclease/exonuclease/phosphatase family metal-dependent hydrolase [Labedaea rhizosphaerae]
MAVLEEFEQVEQPRRWRPGGRFVTGLCGVLTVLWLGYGTVRLVSLDDFGGFGYFAVALALTPYVVAGGAGLGVLMIIIGRRKPAFVLICVTLVLASLVSPRVLRNDQPDATGLNVRVLSANLRLGQADAQHLVDLVRDNHVQILAMQELTPVEVSELDAAGLSRLMPYNVYRAEPGGSGSGIASVFPLRELAEVPNTTFQMPVAIVDLPGNQDGEIVDVHAKPPIHDFATWSSELHHLPDPLPAGRVRMVVGDFNASFDHAAFRNVINRGYRDVAEQLGDGLVATWSQPWVPAMTIDHVLIDRRTAARGYAVLDLPGSDHHAIMADVQIPDHDPTAPPV